MTNGTWEHLPKVILLISSSCDLKFHDWSGNCQIGHFSWHRLEASKQPKKRWQQHHRTDKLCIGSEDGLQFGSSPQFSKKVATSKIKKRAGLGNKFFTERFRPSQKCHRRSWVRICFVSGFLSPRSSHNVLSCFLLQLASERRTQSKVPVKPYSGYGNLSSGTMSLE